ncbi:PQQ-binding-like beta-propeller repeat protein [Vibrio europaeus]|uniref:PQQ-binding-like beta-propeller repeat protein n=1 Tax=Vibrio europaeus TaxID=300876 RepID=A0A178J3I0_9VIBR|nr:PQQ-binding-like beta-propeller repeat protein [Vibrio europaeus]MDC5708404.1 PQQ-binding-like beta-propeller repeat protein [Vibrio europaeus]MDC5713137.1 PQQ-binding-like beta-propeller repeat protein [Vibrio europaeus]MDC5728162.1 PQQ-binding-like beta-propeller repeat protein [Vibrio europaeus]MDC5733243.1 PQQ-binding-like beta-propeller repeat protein [Vibrio europaeus]MDC5742379.1 PQQ-binding-like beta-propeller repeat protein [Vibrio europaeus]
MSFLFLHKDNHYTVINDKTSPALEELPQLEKQGFVNFLGKGIEADNIEHAKFLYLRKMVFGISSGYVFCLYTETGKEVWRSKPREGEGLFSDSAISFVLHNDKIILGVCGQTLCLCAFTGSEVWSNKLSSMGSAPVRLYIPS